MPKGVDAANRSIGQSCIPKRKRVPALFNGATHHRVHDLVQQAAETIKYLAGSRFNKPAKPTRAQEHPNRLPVKPTGSGR